MSEGHPPKDDTPTEDASAESTAAGSTAAGSTAAGSTAAVANPVVGSSMRDEVKERGGVLAQRWRQTIPALADHPLRAAFARQEIINRNVGELAVALNAVCQASEQADVVGAQAVFAFAPCLIDVTLLTRIEAIRATALAAHQLSTARLLRGSTPEGHQLTQHDRVKRAVLQNAAGKPLSLGERRALARRPTRATLSQLLRDPHPMVSRILLANPQITEDDVVRMAAYRPAVAEVAGEIGMAWSLSTRVRMTLVLNPTVPAGIAVVLLGLLGRLELAQVMRAADLSAMVRATAREHYELRPPMPPGTHPEATH